MGIPSVAGNIHVYPDRCRERRGGLLPSVRGAVNSAGSHEDKQRRPSSRCATDASVEDRYGQARLVGLDLLAVAQDVAGTLGKVETVKSVGLVNVVPEFAGHGKVIDGCSDLLVEVLGERGRHARPSCGMNSPPGWVTVDAWWSLLVVRFKLRGRRREETPGR